MIRRTSMVVAGCLIVVSAASWQAGAIGPQSQPAAAPAPRSTAAAQPTRSPHGDLLKEYCVTCHNEKLKTAGLALDGLDLTKVSVNAEAWEKVIRKLRAGTMPPAGRPRPAAAAQSRFVSFLETEIDRAAAANPN